MARGTDWDHWHGSVPQGFSQRACISSALACRVRRNPYPAWIAARAGDDPSKLLFTQLKLLNPHRPYPHVQLFELAVAAAISLFGFQSGPALAKVVGVRPDDADRSGS
jgi:hypothetical protein